MGFFESVKIESHRSQTLKPLTAILIFMLAITPQRLAQNTTLRERPGGTLVGTSTSTIRPWPAHEFFLNVISKSATRNDSNPSHEEHHPHLHDLPNANLTTSGRLNSDSDTLGLAGNETSSDNVPEDRSSSRKWTIFGPTTQNSGSSISSNSKRPFTKYEQTAKIQAEVPFRVFSKQNYHNIVKNYAKGNGTPVKAGNVWKIQKVSRPINLDNTQQIQALPSTRPFTDKISPTPRPKPSTEILSVTSSNPASLHMSASSIYDTAPIIMSNIPMYSSTQAKPPFVLTPSTNQASSAHPTTANSKIKYQMLTASSPVMWSDSQPSFPIESPDFSTTHQVTPSPIAISSFQMKLSAFPMTSIPLVVDSTKKQTSRLPAISNSAMFTTLTPATSRPIFMTISSSPATTPDTDTRIPFRVPGKPSSTTHHYSSQFPVQVSNSQPLTSSTTGTTHWVTVGKPVAEPIHHKVSSVHWGSSGSKMPMTSYTHQTTTLPPSKGTTALVSTDSQSDETISSVTSGTSWTPQHIISATPDETPGPMPILEKPAATIWYKPTINHFYSTDQNGKNTSLETITEVDSNETSSPSVSPPTVSTFEELDQENKSQIIFKIWSYVDGEIEFHSQKKIPAWVLEGYNIKDGQVLNIDDVPEPIKEIVSSALNSSSTITKRHSGPSNDYHWQRLPVIHPDTSATWKPPFTRKPISINYVLWNSTTPRPLPVPGYLKDLTRHPSTVGYDRHKLQEYLFHLTTPLPATGVAGNTVDSEMDSWLKLQCYLKDKMAISQPGPPALNAPGGITGSNFQMPDKDVMSNLAALSIILSYVNKGSTSSIGGTGNFYPESPKFPSFTNTGVTGMSPPHRDAFWSSILPLYQHLINKGQAASSILRRPRPRPRPRPKKRKPGSIGTTYSAYSMETGFDPTGTGGSSYQFYPNSDSVSITEAPDEPGEYVYTKTSTKNKIKGKKGRTKLLKQIQKVVKKKKKKSKKGGGWGGLTLFDPAKFNINFDFAFNVMDILRRKFYTLVALKLAPMILLTILALLPLALLVWPKILGWIKLGHAVYEHYHNKHHHPPKGWHGWGPPHHHHGWGRVHSEKELHHHFHGYPAPEIHSLVQAAYGDRSSGFHNSDQIASPNNMGATGDSVVPASDDYMQYYDPELDTEHNRRVMEILMENKNATLHKLLESWSLERNSTYIPQEPTEPSTVVVTKRKRRKRHNNWRSRNR